MTLIFGKSKKDGTIKFDNKKAGVFVKIALGMIFLLTGFVPFEAFSQDDDIFGIERRLGGRKSESAMGNVFRNAISKFSLELSTGAGYHRNQMDFVSLSPDYYPIQSISDQALPVESPYAFRSEDFAFPVNAGVRINMFGIFTLGGGYGREFGRIKHFGQGEQQLRLEGAAYSFDKFYGTFGLVLYDARRRAAFLNWRYRNYSGSNYYMQSQLKQRLRQNYPWHFILEGEYGTMKISKAYDSHLSVAEPFYSLGLRIEREFSEYARLFVKPAASFSNLSYDKTVISDNLEVLETQTIKQNLYTVNVGLSISIPGTKRCKVPGCGVVMKHLHNGVEYRGSSIWKLQNRKVGQWYK